MDETDSGLSKRVELRVALGLPSVRQNTEAALRIRSALARHLVEGLGADCLFEVTLPNKRRADIMALAANGEIWIIEVKSSHADFQSDNKWDTYLDFCDRYWFATDDQFDPALLPSDQGHWITDGYEVVERTVAQLDKLSAARRKAILLRFAGLAARRLYRLTS